MRGARHTVVFLVVAAAALAAAVAGAMAIAAAGDGESAPSSGAATPAAAQASSPAAGHAASPAAAHAGSPVHTTPPYRGPADDRSLKSDLVERLPEPPELLVFGGSRCTRLPPAYLTNLTGLPAMNLALTNFRPEDAWALLCFLGRRSPETKTRVLWGVTANSFGDIPFARGLTGDRRLSAAFPAALLAEQRRLSAARAARTPDATLSARGFLRTNVYDRRRAAGLTLDRSIARWIARYAGASRWRQRPSTRARMYFEQSLALLNGRGVRPCIVLMPYHPTALAAMERTPWRKRQAETTAYLSELSRRYEFTLLDYTPVESFGGDPRFFYDGAHITAANARLLVDAVVRAAPECFE